MFLISFVDIQKDAIGMRRVKKLYKEAFPKEEQVPFSILRYKAKATISNVCGIYDASQFIGMLCFVYYEDIVFVWYFAISENVRGQGYGSKVLSKIANMYTDKRIVLNIEKVEDSSKKFVEQSKRKAFYIKNGYHTCGLETVEYDVAYEMLCLRGDINYKEYACMMRAYMGTAIFLKFYRKII